MLLVSGLAMPCLADEVPALNITQGEGESQVELSTILSIKYTETDMVINLKDGSQHTFALDEITVMQLGQMTVTALRELVTTMGEGTYVLSDLGGKVVSKGNARVGESVTLPTKKGVYVLKVGDKTKKILVK